MKGYRSISSRDFEYSEFSDRMSGIQVNRELDGAYENELKKVLSRVLDAFKAIDELEERYGFLNPPQKIYREILDLDQRSVDDINSCMELVSFADPEELKDTFKDIFANRSHYRDYITAAQMLENKGINIRNL